MSAVKKSGYIPQQALDGLDIELRHGEAIWVLTELAFEGRHLRAPFTNILSR